MDRDRVQFLRRMAEKSLDAPGTLGHALGRFAQLEQLPGVGAVAERLAGGPVSEEILVRLCLCRCPSDPSMSADAAAIERRFGLGAGSLVKVLRRVQVAKAMGGGASLMAARRDEDQKGGRDDA